MVLPLLLATLACAPEKAVSQTGSQECGHSPNVEIGRRLDAHLKQAVTRGFSGAVLVELKRQVVLCHGYGWTDSTRARAVQPSTLFFIASMTKQLTAAGIMILEESRRLQRTDSVGKFFTGLPRMSAAISLHQLLTHTAGLRQNYLADGIGARDSAVWAVLGDSTNITSAGSFTYTNDAYAVLAAVIEVVSNQSWEAFTQRALLTPAHMVETSFWGFVNDLDNARFAQKSVERPAAVRLPQWGYRGSSGLWSNIIDLYIWYRAAWQGKLLTPTSRDRLFANQITLPSGTGVGYGAFRSTTSRGTLELWIRGTEDFGHSAVMRWFPQEEFLVIVLSNAGNIDGRPANQTISDELVELIARATHPEN